MDFHDRIAHLNALISAGHLGNVAVVDYFSGKADLPIQVALRHARTGRVRLVDLHEDGRVVDQAGLLTPIAA